jgi:hypothetical protein
MITSDVDIEGDNSVLSIVNSSTANIAVSGTFTGTYEDTLLFNDIMVMVHISENATLYYDFSMDGVTAHRTVQYSIDANTGTPHKLARVARYGRVRLQNDGGSIATVSLQTIFSGVTKAHLTTNVSAPVNDFSDAELVRAILVGKNPQGDYENINIAIGGGSLSSLIDPETAAPSLIAPNGVLHVAGLVRLVGDNFIDGEPLLSEIWNTSLVNGGTITTADGELDLNTNTTANGEVSVETRRPARFVTGTFNISHQAMSLPNWQNTDVVRQFGCYDPQSGSNNGVYFENDSGTWTLKRLKNGIVVETVSEGSFNGNSPLVKDDNVHIYEIMYNAGTIFWLQDRKFIHRSASLSSAAYGTSHLKDGHKIFNKNGNTVNNKLVSRGSSIGRIGGADAVPSFKYISSPGSYFIKNTPGRLHRVVITDRGTAAATINIYDSTTAGGTLITSLDTNDVLQELNYELEFDVGLTVEALGSSVKLTVVYD